MGFIKNILANDDEGFYYVIDIEILKKQLEEERDFSVSNKLEASANLNIYIDGEKHNINIWNYSVSKIEENRSKGLVFYFDNIEYKSLEELFSDKLNNLPKYFKIELLGCDSVYLNEYMENHPELNVNDYK